jgi:hypothetical protein
MRGPIGALDFGSLKLKLKITFNNERGFMRLVGQAASENTVSVGAHEVAACVDWKHRPASCGALRALPSSVGPAALPSDGELDVLGALLADDVVAALGAGAAPMWQPRCASAS